MYGALFLALISCGKKKESNIIIVRKPEAAKPVVTQKMGDYARSQVVQWLGAPYKISVKFSADPSLPTVMDGEQRYYDNQVTLVITRADGTEFYRKTFTQNRLMGRALAGSRLYFGGGCIAGVLTAEDMAAEGADHNDVDGIIDQMRVTAGVECALLLYEKAPGEFKASIRSNHTLDVSRIAVSFGGGGHIRAAGFTLRGNSEDCLKEALEAVRRGLEEIREMRPAGEDAPAPADSARRPETTHD